MFKADISISSVQALRFRPPTHRPLDPNHNANPTRTRSPPPPHLEAKQIPNQILQNPQIPRPCNLPPWPDQRRSGLQLCRKLFLLRSLRCRHPHGGGVLLWCARNCLVVGWEEEGSEAAGVGWRRVSAPAVWTSGTFPGRTCCAVEGLAGSALMGFILLQRKRSCHCGRCMILGYAMMQTSPLSRIAFVLPPIRPKYNHIPTDSSPNLKTMVLTKRIVVLLPVSECPKSHVPRKKDHNSPNHGCPPGSRQQVQAPTQ